MNNKKKFFLAILGAVSFFIGGLLVAVWMGSVRMETILSAVVGAVTFGVVMFLLLRLRQRHNN